MRSPKIVVIEQGKHPDKDAFFALCQYEEDGNRTVMINITAQAIIALKRFEKDNNVDTEMNVENLGRMGADWAFVEFEGNPPKEVTIDTKNYQAMLRHLTLTLRSSASKS